MAAGATLARERLGEWRAFLEETLAAPVARARAEASLHIDAAMTAGAATAELAHRLEAAGPYGSGNPEPVFVLPRHRVTDVMAVGADHLRVRAVAGDGSAIEAIAFRAAGKTARRGADPAPRLARPSRRDARPQPLRRTRAGAAEAGRRGGGGAVGAEETRSRRSPRSLFLPANREKTGARLPILMQKHLYLPMASEIILMHAGEQNNRRLNRAIIRP